MTATVKVADFSILARMILRRETRHFSGRVFSFFREILFFRDCEIFFAKNACLMTATANATDFPFVLGFFDEFL